MGVSLSKGGNVSLTKEAPGLTAVTVGLGWDVRSTTGTDFDLDASAILVDANGKVTGDKDFVFFNNLQSSDGSVKHLGDNLTGEGEGDDEQVNVDLAAVPANVDKVVFPVSIYEGDKRSQSFGQVRNAFIRVVNQAGGAEIARYDLSEDASTETAMVFGELYRNGAEWKFRAVGQGYASGLAGIAKDFGVNVSSPRLPRPCRPRRQGRVAFSTCSPVRVSSTRRREDPEYGTLRVLPDTTGEQNEESRVSLARPAAVVLAAVLAGGLLTGPVAAAPAPATPARTQSVTTLPSTTGDDGRLADLWTAATDPAAQRVAAACTGGRPIATPSWALLAPPAPTTVLARTEPTTTSGRTRSAVPGGLAYVDRADGRVLDCTTGSGLLQLAPRQVGTDGVLVVAFALAQPRPADEDAAIWGADEREVPLYLDATTGVRPAADDVAAPTRIATLPYTSTVDRYLATEQAADAGWAGGNACAASAGGLFQVRRSVWWSFVPAQDAVLNASGAVAGPALTLTGATQVGEVTADGPVALDCSQPGADGYRLTAGRTYLVQVADEVDGYGLPDGPLDAGAPRALTLTGTARLQAAPGRVVATTPRLAGEVRLDARTGTATVRGTVSCTGGGTGSARVTGRLLQGTGRGVTSAAVGATVAVRCDGTPQAWSAPALGRVHAGLGVLRVSAAVSTAAGAATSPAAVGAVRVLPAR